MEIKMLKEGVELKNVIKIDEIIEDQKIFRTKS